MSEVIRLSSGDLDFRAETSGFEANPLGPIVICLHGFPDNASSFRHQRTALTDAGYRVITPLLRGYEPSSQPSDNDYSLLSMAGDLDAWVESLDVEQVHLVGHDWGAAIAYLAGAVFPNRFESVTAIAVPHPGRFAEAARRLPSQILKSWYMTFFQLRGVADYAVTRNDFSLLASLWKRWSPAYELDEPTWSDLKETFRGPGVSSAMLDYYRQNTTPGVLLGWRKTDASRNRTVGVRTLAITGTDDGCIDTRLFDHLLKPEDFPNGLRVERIDDAGHFVHIEQPAAVNRLLLDWFDSTT